MNQQKPEQVESVEILVQRPAEYEFKQIGFHGENRPNSRKLMVILRKLFEGLQQELEVVDLRRFVQGRDGNGNDVRLYGMDYLGIQKAFQQEEAEFSLVSGPNWSWVRKI
ncbi:GL26313 [Drosophila persimilis]|uniref:GL26313 n=1 Tax=Drosophila persimilis TaxID=7234 RepID=B4GS84_DROPE|nr:GL26313 [Drosophila persimilis]